jgi:phosphoadenosine phosphosulfate reductase
MRREDAPTRTDIAVVGVDERRGMVKVNAIAAWTAEDVERYTQENGVFENPTAPDRIRLHRVRAVHPRRRRR